MFCATSLIFLKTLWKHASKQNDEPPNQSKAQSIQQVQFNNIFTCAPAALHSKTCTTLKKGFEPVTAAEIQFLVANCFQLVEGEELPVRRGGLGSGTYLCVTGEGGHVSLSGIVHFHHGVHLTWLKFSSVESAVGPEHLQHCHHVVSWKPRLENQPLIFEDRVKVHF